MSNTLSRNTIALIVLALASAASTSALGSSAEMDTPRIRIVGAEVALTASLEDSPAAGAFAAMLPLELTLEDYHGIEKVADLPARLPTEGVPEGIDPEIGDITYYAPWGNLAVFYRDFRYSKGLVRLGTLDGDVDTLAEADRPLAVRIERLEEPE